jgi:putative methionine-R-sulfoxide reductase with GAF domain
MTEENQKPALAENAPGRAKGSFHSGKPGAHPKSRFSLSNMRLQGRLTLLVFLAAIPIFAIGAFLINLRGRQIIEQQAVEQLRLANGSLGGNTMAQITFSTQILNELAMIPDIIGMNPSRQIPILKAVATAQPEYYLVHVMDLSGMDISRSDGGKNTDYKDRLYFTTPIGGGPITFQIVLGKTTGRPALTVGTAIKDSGGKIIGVVGLASDLTELSNYVQANKVGKTGYAYVVDQNNIVVAHPDSAFTVQLTDFSTYPPVARLRQGKTGLVTFTDDKGVAWHAYTSQLSNGWGIIVQQQDAEYLQTSNSFGNISILVFAGGLLVLLFIIWLVIRQATRPIAALTKTAEAIAAGDLTQVVRVTGRDEIGVLGNTFNRMTAQLRDSITTLEQRVADRTKELATVAEVSTTAATILETGELLQEVVDLTKERFGLYHSHIYLLDEAGQNLVLAAGAGEPGRKMVAERRSIPLDHPHSLVARASRDRKGVIVNDVTQEPDFLPNPLLPNTRSELAVPMIASGNLIGIFDIQSDRIGRFAETDINVQTTLAAQVAISIQNVRSFESTRTKANLETQVNAISQKIQSATTVEETLQTAIRELGLALGASRVKASISRDNPAGGAANN